MRAKILLFLAAVALSALSLAGCGSDSASSAPVTGVSRGAITSVGNSITVNGVEFSTTGAAITMDDPTDAATLEQGMVVTVRGEFDDAIRGKAFEVKVANDLKGPIAAFNNLSSSMTILGQNVRFDPAKTVFANFSGAGTSGVHAGEMVRVNGFFDTRGTIHATFVQRKLPDWTAATTVTIRGTISAPPGATTFTIGGLTVNFSGTTLPAGTAAGSFVKVTGTIPTLTSTTLTATSVQLPLVGLQNEAGEGARVDAEGFVFGMNGNIFTLAGTTVDAGNLSLAGIANGSKVEVEGTLHNGKLLATKVLVDDPFYLQTNLVSNIPGLAATTDANLINAWGIARPPIGPWWVNSNGTGVSTKYFGRGTPFQIFSSSRVTIPPPTTAPLGTTATPTGIVFNNFSGFNVTAGVPSKFIFVTEDGTISAWNSGPAATLKVDNITFNAGTGPVYKGAALASTGTRNLLYVANFRDGTVDVFDSNFAPVTLPTTATGAPFTVPSSNIGPPAGYNPFNVMNIGGKLFVTYALLNTTTLLDDVAGQGHGFVEVFNPDGSFVMSLQNGLWFNSPWGIALAPADFGKFSNMLLVGNFGSGQIAAFDPVTGIFMGLLRDSFDDPIVINGLWGLGFGNDGLAGPTNTLFFAAGLNDESDGLFGTLTPVAHAEQNE
ncbi:MAG TPA: TIGR03118 family protein [Geobacteraceae bacterium]